MHIEIYKLNFDNSHIFH